MISRLVHNLDVVECTFYKLEQSEKSLSKKNKRVFSSSFIYFFGFWFIILYNVTKHYVVFFGKKMIILHFVF